MKLDKPVILIKKETCYGTERAPGSSDIELVNPKFYFSSYFLDMELEREAAKTRKEIFITATILFLGLAGVVLNIFQSAWGYVLWIPTNLSMAYLNRKKPLLAALFIAYTISCIWGIVKWSN